MRYVVTGALSFLLVLTILCSDLLGDIAMPPAAQSPTAQPPAAPATPAVQQTTPTLTPEQQLTQNPAAQIQPPTAPAAPSAQQTTLTPTPEQQAAQNPTAQAQSSATPAASTASATQQIASTPTPEQQPTQNPVAQAQQPSTQVTAAGAQPQPPQQPQTVAAGQPSIIPSAPPMPSAQEQTQQPAAAAQGAGPAAQDKQPMSHESALFDTEDLDKPSGNWLKKRRWWEQAKDKYEEIRDVFNAIFTSRLAFSEQRSAVDKEVVYPLYKDIGFEQGELKEDLARITEFMNQERTDKGGLNQEERDFFNKLTAAKNDLEQLKMTIEAMDSIDVALDKAMALLAEKLNEAQGFEQSAWREFDAIAKELNEEKAEAHYYVIDTIHANLKALLRYIQQDFTNYINQIIGAAKTKADSLRNTIKTLKEQGVDLKEKAALLIEEGSETDDAEKKLQEAQTQKPKESKQGLWGRMLCCITNFFSTIWCYILCLLTRLWCCCTSWLHYIWCLMCGMTHIVGKKV